MGETQIIAPLSQLL